MKTYATTMRSINIHDIAELNEMLQALLWLELTSIKGEGISRFDGSKRKIEQLYAELEQNIYAKHDKLRMILHRANAYDLGTLLKRRLRIADQRSCAFC